MAQVAAPKENLECKTSGSPLDPAGIKHGESLDSKLPHVTIMGGSPQGSPHGKDLTRSPSSPVSRSPSSGRTPTNGKRRSSEVLRESKALSEDAEKMLRVLEIRETKKAALQTDDIGAVTSVNEYQIVKDLGKGAFAEVKLCKKYTGVVPPVSPEEKDFKGLSAQESLEDAKDLFAIKIFSKSILTRRRSFQRTNNGRMAVTTDLDKVQKEIAIMKKLVHPNLVRLYEVIDDATQDQLYIVLEYVYGGPIMEYNSDTKRYVYAKSPTGVMKEKYAAQCLVDILAGMVYLHMHHICHRDLKPENVLVDAMGRCKIADFGVAHYFEEEEKNSPRNLKSLYRSHSRGLLKSTDGTWCFWSPEMCQSGAFSGYSADVWAIGVCLWVFIYGTLPFMEDTPDELFDAIAEGELEFPQRVVSPDLVDLLRLLLDKNPERRITLEDALDHEWTQLADEDEMDASLLNASTSSLSGTLGHTMSLRARAYSYHKVVVTEEEVNSAIRSVNNFVLVAKIKRRLTQKLQEARASLTKARSPGTSPGTTPEGSRSATPLFGAPSSATARTLLGVVDGLLTSATPATLRSRQSSPNIGSPNIPSPTVASPTITSPPPSTTNVPIFPGEDVAPTGPVKTRSTPPPPPPAAVHQSALPNSPPLSTSSSPPPPTTTASSSTMLPKLRSLTPQMTSSRAAPSRKGSDTGGKHHGKKSCCIA